MDYHLAVDVGRYGVKTAMKGGYRDWYPSYKGRGFKLHLGRDFRDTDISLKTTQGWFFLGDLAIDESDDGARLMTLSKIHEDTQVFVVAAIARAIVKGEIPNGSSIKITTGVPVNFFNKETKENLRELLCHMYHVEINGKPVMFYLNDILLSVEGVAAHRVLCNKKNGLYRYIDIGSRTVNFGTVKNGNYIHKESGTLDYGFSEEKTPKDFVRKVIADLSSKWDGFNEHTFLLGGGAKYCSLDFQQYCNQLMCATEPEWINVLAFLENGEKSA